MCVQAVDLEEKSCDIARAGRLISQHPIDEILIARFWCNSVLLESSVQKLCGISESGRGA